MKTAGRFFATRETNNSGGNFLPTFRDNLSRRGSAYF